MQKMRYNEKMKKLYSSRTIPASCRTKELIVFDLDGTLTESKANLKPDIARMLKALLQKKKVVVIGGGKYEQFRVQFIARLHCPKELLPKLFLFPATATSFYRYQNGWRRVYAHILTLREKKNILSAFRSAFRETHYVPPRRVYGVVIENRGTEETFSALGQHAPLALKEKWNITEDIRPRLIRALRKHLKKFSIREGGLTSIDITEPGIDKAYGIRQIERRLKVPIKKMLFIGDALYPGGNDYAAKRTGVLCVAVRGPEDTKKIIKKLVARI